MSSNVFIFWEQKEVQPMNAKEIISLMIATAVAYSGAV